MTEAPLLSICIPTFNRSGFLQQNLEALLPQARALHVEVCVCDNASTDGTAQYVAGLQAAWPALRFQQQPHNVGLDRNMLAAIAMARGRHVYPLGDDDLIPSDHLALILQSLRDKPDLLILNGWHTDAALHPWRQHLDDQRAGSAYQAPAEAFADLWDVMPFGSFIASSACFALPLGDRYVGTSHAYTGVLWEGLAQVHADRGSVQVRCLREPVVLMRGAQKTWRATAATIELQQIPQWFALLAANPAYSPVALAIRGRYLQQHTGYLSLLKLRAAGQLRRGDLAGLSHQCNAEQARRLRWVTYVPQLLLQGWPRVAKTLLRRRLRGPADRKSSPTGNERIS